MFLQLALLVAIFIGAGSISSRISAETLSVPFSRGFIGTDGTSTGKADGIKTFATLGVVRSYFIQVSSSSQFGGTQGNDYSGTVRLVLASGAIIDIPGAVNWRDTAGSTLNAIGFLPAPTVSKTIPYGSGQTYTISDTSNFGLQPNSSTLSYADGSNISGNAATSGLLTALNSYLAVSGSNAPTGPVTVNSLTTTDQTPTLTGSVTLAAGDSLTVEVNGVQYSGSALTIDTGAKTWSLTIPDAKALPLAHYDVTATIVDADGYTLLDATTQELMVYARPRFVDAHDATVTAYSATYAEGANTSTALLTSKLSMMTAPL